MRARLLVLLWLCACRSESGLNRPPSGAGEPPPPHLEHRREVDHETGKLVHEWTMMRSPGQGAIKDGIERLWYPSGAKHWERDWKRGKPIGAWRSWHENGHPRSECFYRGPDVDATMTFWHENGKPSAQGPARDGTRRGTWSFWLASGQIAEQGEYENGRREGSWIAWSEDGKQRFERVYRKNVRVSQRPLAEGETPATAAPPKPALPGAEPPDERPPK